MCHTTHTVQDFTVSLTITKKRESHTRCVNHTLPSPYITLRSHFSWLLSAVATHRRHSSREFERVKQAMIKVEQKYSEKKSFKLFNTRDNAREKETGRECTRRLDGCSSNNIFWQIFVNLENFRLSREQLVAVKSRVLPARLQK